MAKSDLYIGKDYINEIYAGSEIISQIYRGNQKIYDVYYDGETIFESSTPQEIDIYIKVKGIYQIFCVGAGGGSGADYQNFSKWHGSEGTGGSGAGVIATFYLDKGVYSIKVGGGTIGPYGSGKGVGGDGEPSYVQGVVTCNGGTGGAGDYDYGRWRGTGGTYSIEKEYIELTLGKNGNNGQSSEGTYNWDTWTGGASVYGGYGTGGTVTTKIHNHYNSPGKDGYVRISYLRHGLNSGG